MDVKQKAGYKAADKDDKANWVRQYLIGTKSGHNEGVNMITCKSTKEQYTDWEWLLESQIGKALNSDALAKELCEGGELDDQPSQFQTFAKKGVEEYHFSWSKYRGGKTMT